jgi:hypothetical protein
VGEAENFSNPVHRVKRDRSEKESAMREQDLRAKYLVLPPNIDIKDIVIEVNTKLTEVEHCGEPLGRQVEH